jgi:hypothetical protein
MPTVKQISFMLSLLAVVWTARPASAQGGDDVQVSATVDRNQVAVGDVVNLNISVGAKDSVNVDEPDLGNLNGLELINSSSGYETRSSYENGRFVTTQARHFNFMLAVNKQGTVTIPDIPVKVDGRTYRTKPIQLSVSARRPGGPSAQARGRQRQAPDPFDQMDDMEELFQQMLQRRMGQGAQGIPGGADAPPVNPNEAFFIQAQVDKTKVYVGEQVTANFYLVTRGQIRDIDTLKYPDLKGFWKEDLEMATRLNFENVVINGIAYQRALLVSYALFPIKAGKATVDSYKAKCTVLTPSAFGFGHPYQFTKASRPIEIQVMDPPANRPADYTGAVGRFHVTAQFEPPTGVVNQPVTLRVRFEGQGNAKLIELPKLQLPPSFEFYDQKSQAKFMKDGTSYKEFEVLIIPREPGVFKVPPVTISVFDPRAAKFSQVSSKPLDLSVTGSATTPAASATAMPGVPTPQAGGGAPTEPRIPPLATEIGAPATSPATMILITVAIFAAAALFLAVSAWRRLRLKPKKISLNLLLKRRLAKARELGGRKEWRLLGVELTNTAYAILGQLTDEGGASQELSRLLARTPPSLRAELSEPIEKLLAQCEALSFAPDSLIGDMTEKAKLTQLMQTFEKVMGRAIELAEI